MALYGLQILNLSFSLKYFDTEQLLIPNVRNILSTTCSITFAHDWVNNSYIQNMQDPIYQTKLWPLSVESKGHFCLKRRLQLHAKYTRNNLKRKPKLSIQPFQGRNIYSSSFNSPQEKKKNHDNPYSEKRNIFFSFSSIKPQE